jgi:hypothetical protein
VTNDGIPVLVFVKPISHMVIIVTS